LLRHTKKCRHDAADADADHWEWQGVQDHYRWLHGEHIDAYQADWHFLAITLQKAIVCLFLTHIKSSIRKPPSRTAMLDLPVLPF